jgi:hypothetical protein
MNGLLELRSKVMAERNVEVSARGCRARRAVDPCPTGTAWRSRCRNASCFATKSFTSSSPAASWPKATWYHHHHHAAACARQQPCDGRRAQVPRNKGGEKADTSNTGVCELLELVRRRAALRPPLLVVLFVFAPPRPPPLPRAWLHHGTLTHRASRTAPLHVRDPGAGDGQSVPQEGRRERALPPPPGRPFSRAQRRVLCVRRCVAGRPLWRAGRSWRPPPCVPRRSPRARCSSCSTSRCASLR